MVLTYATRCERLLAYAALEWLFEWMLRAPMLYQTVLLLERMFALVAFVHIYHWRMRVSHVRTSNLIGRKGFHASCAREHLVDAMLASWVWPYFWRCFEFAIALIARIFARGHVSTYDMFTTLCDRIKLAFALCARVEFRVDALGVLVPKVDLFTQLVFQWIERKNGNWNATKI